MSGDDNEAAAGGEAADPNGPPADGSNQDRKQTSTGQKAREAAAVTRAARALNDARYERSEADALRVMVGMALKRPLASIAIGLFPPYGITVGRLRQLYPYEIEHGLEHLKQNMVVNMVALAGGAAKAVPAVRLRAAGDVLAQIDEVEKTNPAKQKTARAEPEVVVVIKPSLGNNEPTEHA